MAEDRMDRMKRLLLVRHAPTAPRARRPSRARRAARRRRPRRRGRSLRAAARRDALVQPGAALPETAEAAGLDPALEPALAECDFGAWAGRTLARRCEPAAARAWMTDPDAAPHGGESLRAFAARVAAWLDGQAAADGRAVAITHGGVVKAAIVHALGAPLEAFWRIDVAPLALTELHAHDGRWTVTRVTPAAPVAAVA